MIDEEDHSWSSFLAMRLRDGKQACPQCGGAGCYWCRKTGHRSQCPVCMNAEPELLEHRNDETKCLACESVFEPSGRLNAGPEDNT